MDKELLKKYFRNQCSIEEIEQVLNWFQTEEGEHYFKENLDMDMQQYADDEKLLLYPEVASDKLLERIRQSKKNLIISPKKNRGYGWAKLAVAVLICAILGGTGYLTLQSEAGSAESEPPAFRTISTQNDQHRLVTLSDGTLIRLNSNSKIEIPTRFDEAERTVMLTGEAWFDVASNQDRPFHIGAGQAMIRVLGTEFNVKMDESTRNVQVAVAEGKVSLKSKSDVNGREAILTGNTFAVLNADSREILIEQTPVENYLSWINGELYFYDDPLWVVSRYIERLYNVSVVFEKNFLKNLSLSTDMAREDLSKVLDIIAQTLDISYTLENNTVTWQDNLNPNKPSTK